MPYCPESLLTPIPIPILFLFSFGDLSLLYSDFLLHQLEGIFFHHMMTGMKTDKAYQCFWLRKYLLISPLTWWLKTILNLAISHLGSPIDLPLQRQIFGPSENYLTSSFSFSFSWLSEMFLAFTITIAVSLQRVTLPSSHRECILFCNRYSSYDIWKSYQC